VVVRDFPTVAYFNYKKQKNKSESVPQQGVAAEIQSTMTIIFSGGNSYNIFDEESS
jgi:hypothetical protein